MKTYKYFRILEADTIKQAVTKEKINKSILGKPEIYLRPNYIEEISLKG